MTSNASNYNIYRMYWFKILFEKFLFSLKKRLMKSFSKKNIFNSCIENICISIRRLLSMFTRVLRRIRLSIIYEGQWRRKCAVDSISKPQLHNGFKESWKLCLNSRMCSRKWLKRSRSLVINLTPLGLWQLKRLLADGLIICRILFLKILKLLEFLMLWSSLLHSIIVDGKKQLLKKLCLVLKKGILCIFLVI